MHHGAVVHAWCALCMEDLSLLEEARNDAVLPSLSEEVPGVVATVAVKRLKGAQSTVTRFAQVADSSLTSSLFRMAQRDCR